MTETHNVHILLSHSGDIMNVHFNDDDDIIIKIKQKLIKTRKKIYDKMICSYDNITIYINPMNGNIHEIIKNKENNHIIQNNILSYTSEESKLLTDDIYILNTYPNKETYNITEYVINDNTIIFMLINKNNKKIKIFEKTTNSESYLKKLII